MNHSDLLFVYGTLRRGQKGHHVLAGARYVRAAVTMNHYTLATVSSYTGLMRMPRGATSGSGVPGELYQLTFAQLERVDEWEGTNYLRRLVDLKGGDRAWSYFFRVQE